MTGKQITQIAQAYGHTPVDIYAVQKGYRNESYGMRVATGEAVNLIIYKNEAGILSKIHHAHAVAEHLAADQFPVRIPIDSRIIRLEGAHTTKLAALYNYLPGATIPWEAYAMDHLKALGAMLGQLHTSLRNMPRSGLPLVTDELRALDSRMQCYFESGGVTGALHSKLTLTVKPWGTQYQKLFSLLADAKGAQPLHMDFVRGNILFEPSTATICGILDFEKAAWGLPAFDIARTLAFLLVDCKYKSEAQVRKYFLYSGYQKRGGGSLPSSRLLETLLDFFLLHDFYKFLRHNPYESLNQNEHFIRTRDLLLLRSVLKRPTNAKIELSK